MISLWWQDMGIFGATCGRLTLMIGHLSPKVLSATQAWY